MIGEDGSVYKVIASVFATLVEYGILLMELIGVALILYAAGRCLVKLFDGKSQHLSLELARGLGLALEFLLCGEIMHTIVVDDTGELIIVGAIVLMRIAMTVLIHWETKNEKEESTEQKGGGHDY